MTLKKDRYHLLVENLPDAFAYFNIISDSQGNSVDFVFCETNLAFRELFGIEEDLRGKKVRQELANLALPHEKLLTAYQQGAHTEEAVRFEHFFPSVKQWHEVGVYSFEPGYFAAVFRSIGHRSLPQDHSLKESAEQFRRAISNAPSPIMIHAEDGEVVYINDVWTEITGYKLSDIPRVSDWVWKAYGSKARPAKETIESLYNINGKIHEGEFTITTATGRTRVWDFSSAPLGRMADNRRMLISLAEDITEQKGLQKEVYSLKEYFRVTLESIGDAVIATDIKGQITFMNSTSEALTGWRREDALGRPLKEVFNIISEKTRKKCENPVEKVLKSGAVVELANHTLLIRRDGTELSIDDSGAPIRDESDRISGVVLVFRDITEKRKDEAEAHGVRERLQALFEASPLAIIALSPQGHVEMWNGAAENIFGWKESEVLGKMLPIVPEEEIEGFNQLRNRVLCGELVNSLEVHRQKKDGSFLWISISIAPLHDVDGIAVGVMAVAEDITERKKMHLALKESEEKFRLIAENAQDLVYRITLAPEQNFDYISPSATAITGYTPEEHYNDGYLGLKMIHSDDLHILEGIKDGTVSFERPFEIRWRRKDGRVIWIEQRNTPVFDNSGELIAIEGIARDITHRKKLELELQHMSMHDVLTGIYNRAFFEEEMSRLKKGRYESVGIIVMDIDGLKIINDTFGHVTGDEHLKTAANLMKACFRKNDVIARIGGDEFAVLLPNVSDDKIRDVSDRLEFLIDEYNTENEGLPLSIAIGWKIRYGAGINVEELFKEADDDMYRKKLHRNQSTKSAIVNTLMKTLEERDFITEGHTKRMHDSVVQMARLLSLTEGDIADLKLLAQFHDIGKVGIPDRLLFKPGPLTAEEVEEMRRHPEIGYRIALASPDLAPIADYVLKHHEWWNGRGYPLGLQGEQIPLESRILAIVDAYDAMTNDRPYRVAMHKEKAIKELQICAGKQFDSKLVEVFLRVL